MIQGIREDLVLSLDKPLNIEKEVSLKQEPELGVFSELERLESKDKQSTVKRAQKVQWKRVRSRIGSECPEMDLKEKIRRTKNNKKHKTKSVDDEFVLVDSDEESSKPDR